MTLLRSPKPLRGKDPSARLYQFLSGQEAVFIRCELMNNHGNVSATARSLGISPRAMRYKIKQHKLGRHAQ